MPSPLGGGAHTSVETTPSRDTPSESQPTCIRAGGLLVIRDRSMLQTIGSQISWKIASRLPASKHRQSYKRHPLLDAPRGMHPNGCGQRPKMDTVGCRQAVAYAAFFTMMIHIRDWHLPLTFFLRLAHLMSPPEVALRLIRVPAFSRASPARLSSPSYLTPVGHVPSMGYPPWRSDRMQKLLETPTRNPKRQVIEGCSPNLFNLFFGFTSF